MSQTRSMTPANWQRSGSWYGTRREAMADMVRMATAGEVRH